MTRPRFDEDACISAARKLLDEKLSGPDRELCERIVEDGFLEEYSRAEKETNNRDRRALMACCLSFGYPLP